MTPGNKEKLQRTIKYGALAVWAVLIIAIIVNRDKITVDMIVHYTPSNLFLAALVLLLLFALKTMSVFFASPILYTASGLLFPLPLALLVNLLGIIIMASEGYLMGRYFGSDLVDTISEKHPKVLPILHLQDGRPFLFTFLLRMLKVSNVDISSMYLGASHTKFVPYAAASCIALIPELVLYAVLGSSISDLNPTAAVIAATAFGLITIASFLLLAYLVRHPEKLGD